MTISKHVLLTILLLSITSVSGCRTLYYDTMEAFGQHKRDLLVNRVADARDDQQEAKEQFQSALEKFTTLVGAPNTELSKTYHELNDELERSQNKAAAVHDQIESIETVSEDLFAEWESELAQYSSDELRRSSQATLDQTRRRYAQMVAAMRRPEQKMNEVLRSFQDHVLFLKHNLNAQAVASLQGTIGTLELNTAELIAEMEAAISEADSFIQSMEQSV